MARLTAIVKYRYEEGKKKRKKEKKGTKSPVICREKGRYMGEGVEITRESCEPSNFHLPGGGVL